VITIVVAVTPPAPSAPVVKQRTTTSANKRRSYTLALVTVVAVAVVVAILMIRLTNTPETLGVTNPPHEAQKSAVGEDSSPMTNPPKPQPTRPDPRPTEYNSLPTGTRIEKDSETRGHGELTVENGTTEDAVVRLSDATTYQTVRWFFVKASSAHITRIPQGSYRLAYTTGLNWVASDDVFSWQPSYDEFERQIEYDENRDSERVRFHNISVTLNTVLFGNVHTRTITREEFLRRHQHIPLEQVN